MSNAATEIGRLIRNRREHLGLSQGQLAARLERTQTAVSYWESGKRTPSVEDLMLVARALETDTAALMPRVDQEPLGAVLRAAGDQIDHPALADSLERFAAKAASLTRPPTRYTVTAAGARDAAEAVLAAASVQVPPVDVAMLADRCGVRVLVWDFKGMVDGMVVNLADGAAIGLDKGPMSRRQRFTLAHELGHHLLRHTSTFHVDYRDVGALHGGSPTYNWRNERAANEFAANLLMPATLIRHAHAKNPSLSRLADAFDVSTEAMGFRVSSLGLADSL